MRPEELETLLEKLDYLSQGAELVVFAGSLPRDVEDDFYAEAIHDLAPPAASPPRSTATASRCGSAIEAEPLLVSPNQREAEALVGQEFHDDEDFALALDRIADLGARNVIITTEVGCFALLREDRVARRYRVERRGSSRSRGSAAATRCSARSSRPRSAGTAARGALRAAVAAGAASTARARRRPLRPARGGAGSRPAVEVDRADRRRRVARLARRAEPSGGAGKVARWTSESFAVAEIRALPLREVRAGKASPSTTCCSCRPSRRCCRTTSRPRRG